MAGNITKQWTRQASPGMHYSFAVCYADLDKQGKGVRYREKERKLFYLVHFNFARQCLVKVNYSVSEFRSLKPLAQLKTEAGKLSQSSLESSPRKETCSFPIISP